MAIIVFEYVVYNHVLNYRIDWDWDHGIGTTLLEYVVYNHVLNYRIDWNWDHGIGTTLLEYTTGI